MAEILVLYNRFTAPLVEAQFQRLFQQMPAAAQNKISRFRKWQDGQRTLTGNALLIQALQILDYNNYNLQNLKYNAFNRPYFDGQLDFNISHSGNYVMCAATTSGKVGIDVEEIKEIPVNDFKQEFSPKELQEINEDNNQLDRFYSYWTKKEAFLKAVGIGLSVPLNTISVNRNSIKWENKVWNLYKILLDDFHVSCLCTDLILPEIVIKRIDFD